MHKEKHTAGFTLAELLIVVAIIGVLVAISIPIFSGQLEKAREATDAANIRSQYAEVIADAIMDGGSVNKNHATYKPVQLKQQKNEWQNTGLKANLEGVFGKVEGEYPKAKGTAWVEYDAVNDVSILHYEGGSEATDGNGTGGGGSETTSTTPDQPNPDKPDPSKPDKEHPTTGSDSGNKPGSGSTETTQPSTGESTSANILQSFSYKEWPETTDFSDGKTFEIKLATGELFAYKGKHYITLKGGIYKENQYYKDNPENSNNAHNLVCIDNSKIVTELDGRYRADWNKFQIYMNYGDIYKTRKGEYYFYKGASCDQNCPEENADPDQWVKIQQ